MSTDLIRYDLLVQDAMRGVMRRVLNDVVLTGSLPGEHHFTITFRTQSPGVRLSKRLAEQWPAEMTIILQHQFSNLTVDDAGFSVGLSFRNVPEQLYIPFASVVGFFDPSVDFGLTFGVEEEEEAEDEPAKLARPGPQLVASQPASEAAPAAKPAGEKSAAEKPAAEKPAAKKDAPKEPAPVAAETAEEPAAGDSKIVSIDAFRKKH
jgi:uncharacterized protein